MISSPDYHMTKQDQETAHSAENKPKSEYLHTRLCSRRGENLAAAHRRTFLIMKRVCSPGYGHTYFGSYLVRCSWTAKSICASAICCKIQTPAGNCFPVPCRQSSATRMRVHLPRAPDTEPRSFIYPIIKLAPEKRTSYDSV